MNSTQKSLCQEVLCHSLGQAENFALVYCQSIIQYNLYWYGTRKYQTQIIYLMYENAENVPVLSSTNEVPI